MNIIYAFTRGDAEDLAGRPLDQAELSTLAKALEGVHEYVSEVASSALAEIIPEEPERTL